jgi:hypothetical protein
VVTALSLEDSELRVLLDEEGLNGSVQPEERLRNRVRSVGRSGEVWPVGLTFGPPDCGTFASGVVGAPA